jgi:hypothetical protein
MSQAPWQLGLSMSWIWLFSSLQFHLIEPPTCMGVCVWVCVFRLIEPPTCMGVCVCVCACVGVCVLPD